MKKPFASELQQLPFTARMELKQTIRTELNLKPRSMEMFVYGRVNLTPLTEKFIRSLFAQHGIKW